jgi:hypothetical protein
MPILYLIGFANDEIRELVFTGQNIALQNIINSGEKFSLYWKNDGQPTNNLQCWF